MAYIRFLPNGRWSAQVYLGAADGTGKTRWVTKRFDAKKDAEAWARKLEAGRDEGSYRPTLSKATFADYLRERVIGPLGMIDTDFQVRPQNRDRFAACYVFDAERKLKLYDDAVETTFARPPAIASGGGGLVSTAADYQRFCRFILNRGTLDGVRLLGRKTVDLMLTNHLRGDLAAMGTPRFAETSYDGIGFGLGFSVMLDPARAQILGSPGEVAWGGLASTGFWIDPAEDLSVVLLTQLIPSSALPIRKELRVMTYAALAD